MSTTTTTTTVPILTTAPAWDVYFTVLLTIVGSLVVGVAIVMLLVFIGTKRRLMAVKNQFVPVLSQKISARQKAVIMDEHTLEASFAIEPPAGADDALHSWFAETPHKEAVRELEDDIQRASASGVAVDLVEPQVLPHATSRHAHEHHLASLVARSHHVIEVHAAAVSPALARQRNQEVSVYVRRLQTSLRLDKRLCDRYLNAYLRARWSGPYGGAWTTEDFLNFDGVLRALKAAIDGSA